MTVKEEKTRLTSAKWAEAEAAWSSGEFSLSQLEAKFGVRRETLSRHFKKEKSPKGLMLLGRWCVTLSNPTRK